jgi:arabinofuranosyltransferase
MSRKQIGWALLFGVVLVLHARLFDFICDDAFITFRYAKNLVETGAPVYNLSERVEGYTNFLWMLGMAAGFVARLDVSGSVLSLGIFSSLVLGGGLALCLRAAEAKRPLAWAALLVGVASTASLAAWTLSGLETTMYTAFVVLGAAFLARTAANGQSRDAVLMGLSFALATLTRPEGAATMAIACVVLFALRRVSAVRLLARASATYLAILVPFVAWRWNYYGDPLPNTFYLKTGGDSAELRRHGLRYVELAVRDYGFSIVPLALAFIAPVVRSVDSFSREAAMARRALGWFARIVVVALVPYVISVGGDFLGLFRFLVPFVPLLWLLFALVLDRQLERLALTNGLRRTALAALAVAFVAFYAHHQLTIGELARTETNPDQQASGIEPIHWTRLYALRWGAMGRWIAERADGDDWMAVGAAGAMPYYASISNLDVLGLCDRYVAREGIIVGSRPGHQRRAPIDYTLSRQPVFLFEGDFDSDERRPLRRDRGWENRGYVWTEAHVREGRHGAPRDYYFYFLMRKDRAERLRGDPDVRFAN